MSATRLGPGVLLVAIYIGLGLASLQTAYLQTNDATFWIPSGFSVALLVARGREAWPVVTIGALVTNLLVNLHAGTLQSEMHAARPHGAIAIDVVVACIVSLGNTAEALIARGFLDVGDGTGGPLRRPDQVFRFALGAAVAPLCSAVPGVACSRLAGLSMEGSGWEDFFNWYIANSVGILVFAVPMLQPLRGASPRQLIAKAMAAIASRRRGEAALLLVGLVAAAQSISGSYLGHASAEWPRVYTLFPLLIWATFRFRLAGTLASLMLVSLFSAIGSIRGFHAFPATSLMHSLLGLQAFLGLLSVTMLLLAAGLAQIDDLTLALRGRLDESTGETIEARQRSTLLTSLVVHDVRSPILAMRNGLSAAKHAMTATPPDYEGVLEIIRESEAICSKLAGQIGGLLRGEHGLDGDRAEGLVEIVDRSLSMARAAGGRGVVVEASGLDGVAVSGAIEVERIIVVILANALKFAAHRVVIEAARSNDDRLIVSIADDGPGLRPLSARAVSAVTAIDEGGIGLGLDLARRQAAALGIRIDQGDAALGGALFTITIPPHRARFA